MQVARERETRVMMPRRTSGSPPVSHNLLPPLAMKAEHRRSGSSARARRPSAGRSYFPTYNRRSGNRSDG